MVASSTMTGPKRLRALLEAGGVLAPGSFDAFSAHLVEQAGFDAVYVSGLAVEATQFATPDIGFITRPDMIAHADRIVEAVEVPVICDADTGFGDGLQILKTVRQFERIGVAAIHIEDQMSPKGCPSFGPAAVLPRDAAFARIRTAVEARTDPDFVIIARTDAESVSFDEAVVRANAYLGEGADMVLAPLMYVNGTHLSTLAPADQYEWLARLAKEVDGPMAGFFIPPGYRADDMFDAGYALVINATPMFYAAATAMLHYLEEFARSGTPERFLAERPIDPRVMGLELARSLGFDEHRKAQHSFPTQLG